MPLIKGYARRQFNPPLEHIDLASGYRSNLFTLRPPNNDLWTFFILTFSGGGTRAGSLSYGVLEDEEVGRLREVGGRLLRQSP